MKHLIIDCLKRIAKHQITTLIKLLFMFYLLFSTFVFIFNDTLKLLCMQLDAHDYTTTIEVFKKVK